MSEMVFCYSCRRYHPIDEMTQVSSGRITRWRCRKSLASSHTSVAERDAFGKAVSAQNLADKAWQLQKPLPRPVLELMGGRAKALEVPA